MKIYIQISSSVVGLILKPTVDWQFFEKNTCVSKLGDQGTCIDSSL
jgi:hypothetical protein